MGQQFAGLGIITRGRKVFGAFLLGVVATLGTACADTTAPEPNEPELTTISVVFGANTIVQGAQTTATASGVDQAGQPIPTGTITWTSSPEVSVSQAGQVTALAPGQATVTATAGGVTGQATLTVTALPPSALQITGDVPTTAGNRATLPRAPTVRLINASGNAVSQAGVVVTASVSTGSIIGATTATTDANGVATFSTLGLTGTAGARTVTFSAPGLTAASFGLTLSAGAASSIAVNGGNQQTADAGALVAIAPSVLITDADQNPVANLPVTFEVTTGGGTLAGATTPTNAQGIATLGSWRLGAPGFNSIQARANGLANVIAFTALATQAPVLTSIAVVIAPTSIQVGQTSQATATGTDQYGGAIATGPITWSSNSAVASVSAMGVVTGLAPGQAIITATAGGKSGQAIVTALAVPTLNTLFLTVTPTTILAGQTAQATVSGLDQFGAPIAVGNVIFNSNSVAATVSASGVVTGVSAGVASISATVGNKTALAQIQVAPAPSVSVLTSLEIVVPATSVNVGAQLQATAVGRDQFGQTMATGAVTWAATGAASINQLGLITGVSAGNATIQANVGSLGAQTGIVVVATMPNPATPVLTSLVVSLSPNTIISGGTSQASAQGFDQFGQPIATGPVTYSAHPADLPQIALTVSPSGAIQSTNLLGGQKRIVAKAGSVTGEATLLVRYPTRIVVTAPKNTLIIGESVEATMIVYDQFDNPVDFPFTASINCNGGCSGAATIVRTSLTTATVTATKVGSIQVTARSATGPGGTYLIAGKSITIDYPPYLADLVVTYPASLQPGETKHIEVSGVDQHGAPFPVGQISYFADPTYVATITQFGDISAVHPGTVTVSIVAPTRIGTVDVNITKQKMLTVTGAPTARLVANTPPAVIPNRSEFPVRPRLQITDKTSNQPVPWNSLTVTATLTSGDGTLIGTKTSGTQSDGAATFDGLSLRGSSGPKTITFTAPGVDPVTWDFTLGPSTPAGLTLNAGNNQSAAAGSTLPINPSVKVTDIDGNPVRGHPVNFTVTAGGGTLTPANPILTDTNGIAQISWKIGATGTNTLSVQASGVGALVTFNATGTP